MDLFATVLSRLVDRPVLNKTTVSGNYDFKLIYDQSSTVRQIRGMDRKSAEGRSIFAAIENLG
jgi:uncharacterized protein (TIGR03435 family)